LIWLGYRYDAVGNLISTSDPSASYTFGYDSLNRPTSVSPAWRGRSDSPRAPARLNALADEDLRGLTNFSDVVFSVLSLFPVLFWSPPSTHRVQRNRAILSIEGGLSSAGRIS
jgi:YD repeat-containing protein